MNILIVTQYFYPENFKSNDMAFELQKRGHQVTVLTGLPNYPEGSIYKDYGFFKNTKQNINGVTVKRAWLLTRGKGSGVRIFLNYFSWAFFASIKAFFMSFNSKYDAIIVHEPSPITQFFPAWVFKLRHKTPIYFWVLDLWPESLQIAGGINNQTILNVFKKMVISFYNASDKILISSKGFKKSILEKGDFSNKLIYFPNWGEDTISDGDVNFPIPSLPDGFKVMFAGNIGEAQDLDTIMKAALLLKENQNIKLILVGDGRKAPFVKEFIKNNELENTVKMMGKHSLDAMASFFDKANFMLVSLKDDPIFNLTIPAKVQAYMSAGKPIIAMLNGEGGKLINEVDCGFSLAAGDSVALAHAIKQASLLSDHQIKSMEQNSKAYYKKHFTLTRCIDNLEEILTNQ